MLIWISFSISSHGYQVISRNAETLIFLFVFTFLFCCTQAVSKSKKAKVCEMLINNSWSSVFWDFITYVWGGVGVCYLFVQCVIEMLVICLHLFACSVFTVHECLAVAAVRGIWICGTIFHVACVVICINYYRKYVCRS